MHAKVQRIRIAPMLPIQPPFRITLPDRSSNKSGNNDEGPGRNRKP